MNERTVFIEASEIVSPSRRAEFLDSACAGDATLRQRVEALLESHAKVGGFLDKLGPERLAEELADVQNADATVAGSLSNEPNAVELEFLTPSDTPGSLGRLGHYNIQEVIGRGGMGIVLRAFDEKLHRIVAVKVLAAQLATSATARKRFAREAQAAAAVSHDHVVTIYAVEETNGHPYIAMQFVAGVSLEERISRSGPMELPEILRIGMQAASGLAAAHAQGLIHRDIKPANILLENGVERVKITDFGLARVADDASLTQTGAVAGTPHYMAPEQARGDALDARTDLFSLGSVLYAMCTGRSPFRASSSMAVLRRVCEETPTPISQINAQIPSWLAAIVEKLHAKDPAERFQSAAEVADLLGRHLAHVQHPSVVGPVSVSPVNLKASSNLTPRRRQWAMAAAILLACLLGVASWTEATGVTQLAPTLMRIVTGEGTLLVEVNDPSVRVTIEGDGGLAITGAGPQELRVQPGSYKVHATKDGKPVPLDRDLVTMMRGEKQVVKISRVIPAPQASRVGLAPDKASDPFSTDEWDWTTPVNLGPPVNSKHGDFFPFLCADGLTLIFASDRPGGHGRMDLWLSARSSIESPWQPPINLGTKLNTDHSEGRSFLSADGLTLFVESDRPGGQGHWDLWMYQRESSEAEWSDASNMGPAINSPWAEGGPHLAANGLVLLFQSTRPGGEGRDDLWMSHRASPTSKWSTPVPLGASINTDHDELCPSLSPDGRTLFFCSNRAGNDAVFDLWMSRGASAFGPWSRPVNLGPVMNSGAHDKGPSLAADCQSLVFESGRAGGFGAHDLWIARLTPKIDYVGRAKEHAQQGRTDAAANDYHTALDLIKDPNPYGAERLRVVDQFVASEKVFDRVTKLRSSDINLWSCRAHYLAKVGRWDESISCYQKRLDLGSDGAGFWQIYSLALLGQNDDAAYRNLCEKILAGFANSSNSMEAAHAALAMAVLDDSVKDQERALQMAERAANDDSQDVWWINATYAAWLYRSNRLEEALEWLGKSQAGDYQGFTLCFLAMAHHRLGHAEEARRCADAARQKKSKWTDAVTWYHRVRVERLLVEMDSVLAADPDKLPTQ